MGDREKPSPMAERSGFNKSGNWYERSGSGGYRYWNRDGGQYEYDGEGLGYYRNLRGTQYSEGRPYESYFDYPNDTREDFFLDSDQEQGDVDEQLIKVFEYWLPYVEDQQLDDERNLWEANDGEERDSHSHEQQEMIGLYQVLDYQEEDYEDVYNEPDGYQEDEEENYDEHQEEDDDYDGHQGVEGDDYDKHQDEDNQDFGDSSDDDSAGSVDSA